jgi:hypothetical protein
MVATLENANIVLTKTGFSLVPSSMFLFNPHKDDRDRTIGIVAGANVQGLLM